MEFFLEMLVSLMSLSLAVGAPTEECCATKVVGGVTYSFVQQLPSAVPAACLSNCVYQVQGGDGVQYCFGVGDMEVHCGNVTDSPTDSTTGASVDDAVTTRVKGYIDASTCGRVSSSSSCGSSAASYYREFLYSGSRVIVSNQVPDHDHEHDMLQANPNSACERYQYVTLPIDPAKGSSATRTGLGTIGLSVTGGAFFNDWSSPTGSLALTNEGRGLDSCFGHSAPGGSYHYHANINCSSAGAATGAQDPDTCKLIGYYLDGVPVYGMCKDSSGALFTSCYSCTGSCSSSVTTVGGTFTGLGLDDGDYQYVEADFTAGNCNLDLASGALHPTTGKYSYFMTTGYPWTPIYYHGDNNYQDRPCSAD